MSLKAITIRKITALLNDMPLGTVQKVYAVTTALLSLEKRKKDRKHIDKISIACYNEEKEQTFRTDVYTSK